MMQSIVFIGGGNMTTSLISGLRHAGWSGDAITVVDHNADKRERLSEQYGVQTVAQAESSHLRAADAVVLAVKPQVMAETARALAPVFEDARPLILSIAAGIPLSALRRWLGADFAYVRCMPNTPSLLGVGATGLYADEVATTEQRQLADDIMATAGINAWVDDESLIDAVIATSGSGPAYFFAFMEAMIAGARDLGLDETAARELVLQTALGAARMATESGDDPATLRAKVTSKGGTTAAALNHFEAGDLDKLVAGAMHAASDRASELARDLSDG
ncbi:pyrroline-5-carboxylate reductase [Salinisphaera hydrothermalis]|uniref:Pyrroline-5-carboxylate reductase n=1 Tax=Salinisphaera hydrothermalis (strain C41B8) TaxID=1304275 RepID=A0A084IKZ0_SALHC|nr:pyrroline-5-carboxylate reductase [Salinisphaera hydrothermalis]KEZ77374.1 pyrroline-5-carboxylate reductase [Salinisphaera hydrothermalis C41B8]